MTGATLLGPAVRGRLALLACVTGMMSSMVALFIGTFPLFLQPVSAQLGWGRTTFPTMLMAIALSGAVLGPLFGRLIDRFGARWIGIVGTLLWGVGLVLLSRLGEALPFRVLVIACMGLGGGLAGQLVYARVASRWFPAHGGMVLGIVLGTAPAIGQALAAPAASALLRAGGWRLGYLVFGTAVLAVTLVLNLLFLREPTEPLFDRDAPAAGASGDTARSAIGSARFWLLTGTIALGTAVYNGLFQHSVAIFAAKGLAPSIGTAFVSITALAAIPSPLFAGLLLDRVRSPRSAVVPFLAAEALGAVLIANAASAAAMLAAAVLMGVTLGVGPAILPFLLQRYFGARAQSEIFGASLIGIIAGTASGPVLMGALYDRSGSYADGLALFELLALVALLTSFALPGYRYAAKGSGAG